MQIVIGNNQVRVKDCYAPAPDINLTLRANGEEEVQVMDSLGQFVRAGFDAPTIAPTLTLTAIGAPGFKQPTWICYRYVYAATNRYPLIENAVTAGGDASPRSNPSPSATINVNVANRGVIVQVTKAGRVDLNKIWIYRTDFYLTQEEAEQASEEGNLYFVAAIVDDGIAGTTSYLDDNLVVTGNETMETDNFPSEQFALCVYVTPYFYGYSNRAFVAPISIDANGLITLTNAWTPTNLTGDKWFDGRDGQLVNMLDITNGGFDGYGTYYFKVIDNTTGQLYLDRELTQEGPSNYAGTTTITIKGPSTNLYRSKPNNPFSWGETVVIGTSNIPRPWVHRVGGGQGTAITVVPVLNLLKVDTEGPNKTYVFNIKAQGDENFIQTKQEISSDYTASNHWSQFPAKTAEGDSLIWFIDNKYNVICQSDGSNNRDVSSPVFNTIRATSTDPADRLFSHGAYDPRTQLSVMWVTAISQYTYAGYLNLTTNNTVLAYHHPTDTWSILNYRGVLCSTDFLDQTTNQQMVLIGTEDGRIGRLFAPDRFTNWIVDPLKWPRRVQTTGLNTATVFNYNLTSETDSLVGLWMSFLFDYIGDDPSQLNFKYQLQGAARISAAVDDGDDCLLTFDRFIRWRDGLETDATLGFSAFPKQGDGGIGDTSYYYGFLEYQVCNGCKVFDLGDPSVNKTISEIWARRLDDFHLGSFAPIDDWHSHFHIKVQTGYPTAVIKEFNLELKREENELGPFGANWYVNQNIAVDNLKTFALSLTDVGNYDAVFTGLIPIFKQSLGR